MKPTRLIATIGAAMLLGGAATYAQGPGRGGAPAPGGQAPGTAAPGVPAAAAALAGLWVVQDPGSGSFNEWFFKGPGPQAQVHPEVAKLNAAEDALLAAGNVTNTQPQTPDCPRGNLPLAWASSGIQTLTVTPTEVRMTGQVVYTDGRPHPDVKSPQFVPSGTGHSIGRWEGGTLVVDVIGFPAKSCDSRYPNWRVPGGGRISESTHLNERLRLVDPDTLEVVYTWSDPKIYLKPHTYTYRFKRTVRQPDDPAHPAPTRKFLTDEFTKP